MIIGLVGYKGSGKTVAANFLAETFKMERINFKDALIQEIKNNFPDLLREIALSGEAYSNDYDEMCEILSQTKPPLMRALMQNYGTEVRRKEDRDYWVGQWWSRIMKQVVGDGPIIETKFKYRAVVTDDVRFLNEAEAIKDLGGIIIRIERTDIDNGGNHQSETEQNEIVADHTITVGLGEIDKLTAELKRIVDSV